MTKMNKLVQKYLLEEESVSYNYNKITGKVHILKKNYMYKTNKQRFDFKDRIGIKGGKL